PSKENYNRLVEEGGKYLDNLVVDYMRRLRLKEHPELKLPNLDNMVFPEPKFTKYLFSPGHEKGWAKGKNITDKLGYSIDNYKDYIQELDRKSTRLNSSHVSISYAVFCLKKKQ